jgi:hypothetical protein
VASKTEEYRTNARECEQLAEQIRDVQLIAQQWRDMADRAEKYLR